MYPTTGENPHQFVSIISIQCSILVEIDYLFLLQEAMSNYNKIQDSPYNPTKLAFHSIWRPQGDIISKTGQNFKKKTFFVDDIVLFIVEENIVSEIDFDCLITSSENPTKI